MTLGLWAEGWVAGALLSLPGRVRERGTSVFDVSTGSASSVWEVEWQGSGGGVLVV